MKYLLSTCNDDVVVGLIKEEGAEEEINLAHNVLNCNGNASMYHGCIFFKSVKLFYRFLINKWYFRFSSVGCLSSKENYRLAAKKVRNVLSQDVELEDFMKVRRAA